MTPPILGIWASQISGHLWAPAGAYDALATVTVGSTSVATISFSGIPQGYKHLQIRGIARAVSGNAYMKIQYNGDTGANYTYHQLFGSGTAAAADAGTAQTGAGAMAVAPGSIGAGIFAPTIIDILDYSSTAKNKTQRELSGFDSNGGGDIRLDSGLWLNTSAINQITLVISASTFAQYSQFALYGIR